MIGNRPPSQEMAVTALQKLALLVITACSGLRVL